MIVPAARMLSTRLCVVRVRVWICRRVCGRARVRLGACCVQNPVRVERVFVFDDWGLSPFLFYSVAYVHKHALGISWYSSFMFRWVCYLIEVPVGLLRY